MINNFNPLYTTVLLMLSGKLTNKMATNAALREDSNGEDQDEEEKDGKGQGQYRWWHVNKTGFPIAEKTWECMWDHVIKVHPQGEQVARSIRDNPDLEKVDQLKYSHTPHTSHYSTCIVWYNR